MVPLELMVIFPETVRVLVIESVAACAPPRVSDLQTAEALIDGWKLPVKLASPIMASVDEVGTPAVQLATSFQEVLDVPFQLVCAMTG